MSEVKRDRLVAGFDAGLFDASKLLGGVFVRKTNVQRNAIGKGYRAFDVGVTTLCYVTADSALYELISNPDTDGTSDTDWKRVLTVTSGLQPLGVWNIDNVDPELQDADAEEFNANFYFVTGAASPTLINIPGLFADQSMTVKDGDLIVSNGTVWFVNPLNISWDTLDKPQVIIDYVNGEVISHTHEIADIASLQDELDLKYDEGDVAPLDEEYGTIPDSMLINLGFLKAYYYRATEVYTKDEVDDLISVVEDYYTKSEIDDLFETAFTDVQTWVTTNYYDQDQVDALIAAALGSITAGKNVVYMGVWNATAGLLPDVDDGSGVDGAIEMANMWDIELDDPETPVTIGGVELYNGSVIRAKENNPGQNIAKYKVSS